MDAAKRKRLEAHGWKVGSADEFLQLSSQEQALVEIKLVLSRELKERRKDSLMSQLELAKLLRSRESRVVKMEKGDPSIPIDMLIKSLLAIGATKNDIGNMISSGTAVIA